MTVSKGLEKPSSSRKRKTGVDSGAEKVSGPDPSQMASEQAISERALLQRLLKRVAKGLAGWEELGWVWADPDGDPSSWSGLAKVALLYAQVHWTENRLDQMTTLKTPCWCPDCPGDPYPGGKWMKYECLDHAQDMNVRSAISWGRMVFSA